MDNNKLEPFKFWAQKVLPLVYDDSVSYYEVLCKVVEYINQTLDNVDTLHTDVTGLHDAYVQLQDYVNNYFDNLDVQNEINNKLDEMAIDGTLNNLINPLIPPTVTAWLNENVDPVGSAVIVDPTLTISGAAADAKVTGDNITNLKADFSYVNAKSFGAKGDGVTNDYQAIQKALDYGAENGLAVYLPAGTYIVNSSLNNKGVTIFGASIKIAYELGTVIKAGKANMLQIMTFSTPSGEHYNRKIVKNLTFDGDSKANVCLRVGTTVFLYHVYCMNGVYGGALLNDCYNGYIESCIFNHNGRYGLSINKRNNNLMVVNSIINDNGTIETDANLVVENDSYNNKQNNANVKIIGCEIDGSTGYNVSLNGCDVITFDKCYFEKTAVNVFLIRGVGVNALNIIGCYFLDVIFDLTFSGLFIGNAFRLINKESGTAKVRQSTGKNLLIGGNYIESGYST